MKQMLRIAPEREALTLIDEARNLDEQLSLMNEFASLYGKELESGGWDVDLSYIFAKAVKEDLIPDLQARLDHIMHEQVLGIAITEMTSLLARRSVYCSKYPNSKYSVSLFNDIQGNIRFKNTQHMWQNGKCVWCDTGQKALGDKRNEEGLEVHAYEFTKTKSRQHQLRPAI